MISSEPYWRDVLDHAKNQGKTDVVLPIHVVETLLARLDFANAELVRLERKVYRFPD